MTVATVLRHYLHAKDAPTLGSRRSTRKDTLATELTAVGRRNQAYFIVCFTAVVLLLIGAAVLVVMNLNSVSTIRAVFAILGLSVTGLTAQMASLWKQKVLADMLLALAGRVEQDQLKNIFDAVLAKV